MRASRAYYTDVAQWELGTLFRYFPPPSDSLSLGFVLCQSTHGYFCSPLRMIYIIFHDTSLWSDRRGGSEVQVQYSWMPQMPQHRRRWRKGPPRPSLSFRFAILIFDIMDPLHARAHCGGIIVRYYRRKKKLCQNMKIHHILRPEPKGMWWFCGCLTPVRLSQSWGSWAERWREGIRSANLMGSCSSGMTRSKILTHSPKTTCQAPSDLSTDWPPNSASFSLGSTSKVTWVI